MNGPNNKFKIFLKNQFRQKILFLLMAFALIFIGCNDDSEEEQAPAAIEIAGTWNDNYSGTHTISNSSWITIYSSGTSDDYSVEKFDNENDYAITKNSSDSDFNPDKYNKIVWTENQNNSFYYCMIDFGLDTLEDAENTSNSSDASDPENGGCENFPWTLMTKIDD